jgi:hypothetical protein
MEPEGTEIGLDKNNDTGTAGQPIVQEEEYSQGEIAPVEKDLPENTDPAGEEEPARVKEHNGEKEHRKDTGRTEEKDPAGEEEAARVKAHTGEKEHRKDTDSKGWKDPAGEKWSEKEHHGGPPPGNVPIPVPDGDPGEHNAGVPFPGTGKKTRVKKKPVNPRPVTDVHRKTEIFGMAGTSFPEEPARVRRRTERSLKDPGFGISYAQAEKAMQDLVCSLVERQDRMNAGILLDIRFMQEDIGILQDQLSTLKTRKSGSAAAGEKK